MSSDLGNALARRGHQVDVVLVDWNAEPGTATQINSTADGVNVIAIAPRATRRVGLLAYRITKMLLSPWHAAREMRKHVDVTKYDVLIAFTPASTLAQPINLASKIPSRILFVFDFYPIYQREIGMIPDGLVFKTAMRREKNLYRTFTTLVSNLPSNITYLKRHYDVRADQRVVSAPLWSDVSRINAPTSDVVRARYSLPLDRPIAIFGGQITDGRGVEFMLEAARHALDAGSSLYFLFVGDGRLTDIVDERARAAGNVRRIGGMSREDYLVLASACNVGMIATVPGVSSFNFPTKTIDYLRANLPIVAAVEPGSDYPDILTSNGVGDGVDFLDAFGFFKTAERLVGDPILSASIAKRARQCLYDVFDVERAVELVEASIKTI